MLFFGLNLSKSSFVLHFSFICAFFGVVSAQTVITIDAQTTAPVTINTDNAIVEFSANLNCSSAPTGNGLLITADNVTVNGNGYAITGITTGTALNVNNNSNVVINNLNISGTTGSAQGNGIYLANAASAQVNSCNANYRNNGFCVTGTGSSNIVIDNSTASFCNRGLYTYLPGTGNSYSGNTFDNASTWAMYIHMETPSNISTLDDNDLSNSTNGISLHGLTAGTISNWDLSRWNISNQALEVNQCSNLTFDNVNTSYSGGTPSGCGIYFRESHSCQVTNSNFSGRNYGIALTGAATVNNSFENNTVTNCNSAIYTTNIIGDGNSFITNNLSNSTGYAIYLNTGVPSNLATLDDNNMTGCASGIYLLQMSNVTIADWNLSQWQIANLNVYLNGCTNIIIDNLNVEWTGASQSGYGVCYENQIIPPGNLQINSHLFSQCFVD